MHMWYTVYSIRKTHLGILRELSLLFSVFFFGGGGSASGINASMRTQAVTSALQLVQDGRECIASHYSLRVMLRECRDRSRSR